MKDCLNENQLQSLLAGDPDAVSKWFDHVAGCKRCRDALFVSDEFASVAVSMHDYLSDETSCLGYEKLAGFMSRSLSNEDMSSINRHLALCAECRGDLEALKAEDGRAMMREMITLGGSSLPKPAQPKWSYIGGLGIAASLAAALLFVVIRGHSPVKPEQVVVSTHPTPILSPLHSDSAGQEVARTQKEQGDTKPTESNVGKRSHSKTPYQAVANRPVLKDGDYLVDESGTIRARHTGRIVDLPAEVDAMVRGIVKTGEVPGKHMVLMAKADTDVLRGSGESTNLEPSDLRPNGYNVRSDYPTLGWSHPERIEEFTVRVFTTDGQKIWESNTKSFECKVAIPLKRNTTYLWNVGSKVGDETFYSKAASFKVLSEMELQSLENVGRSRTKFNLVDGSILEGLGLYDEASVAFQRLSAENPDSFVVNKIRERLETKIKEAAK